MVCFPLLYLIRVMLGGGVSYIYLISVVLGGGVSVKLANPNIK